MRVLVITIICIWWGAATAQAAVLFNEIAWMGTEESHLCNWIEFYNSGDAAVDVGDWTLYVDDTARPLADGEGNTTVVPAGAYWVLERVTNTCPDPVPDTNDWYVAFGNLPNAGATLRLERADGGIEDQVAGGEDWNTLGGDNDTKATAQRTEGGWITATATPGAPNASKEQSLPVETVAGTSTVVVSDLERTILRGSDAVAQAQQEAVEADLQLSLTAPDIAYVNQPVSFGVTSSGPPAVVQNSLSYQWNFGDTHTSTEAEPTHTFSYPGTYVVIVETEYRSYRAVARHEITVLPIPLSLSRDSDGNIQLHNDAPYEVDISHYTLVGASEISFPENSIMLPQSTVTVTQERLEPDVSGLVTVHDAESEVVTSNYTSLRDQVTAATDGAEEATTDDRASASSRQTTNEDFTFAPQPTVAAATTEDAIETTSTQTPTTSDELSTYPTESSSTVSRNFQQYWPYLGLLVLLSVAAYAVFRRPDTISGDSSENK